LDVQAQDRAGVVETPAPVEPEAAAAPWRTVVLLGIFIALGPLTIDTYLPALPALTREMSASASAAQLTVTGVLIGLGLGQLVVGPLSDSYGRRRPFLIGVAVHVVASLLCAVAPTMLTLDVLRLIQGVGAAAASVVAMAVVRDLFSGSAAASVISRLVMVMGLAPVVAPSLGGLVLEFGSWRLVFVVLAGLATLIAGLAVVALKETLPVARRTPVGVRAALRGYAELVRDPALIGFMVVAGLTMAAVFAYVSGASFVMQEGFGVSERTFGVLFGLGAVGLIAASQGNVLLLRRFEPGAILSTALLGGAGAGLALIVTAVTGFGGLLGILIPLWVVLAMVALSGPNATALALARHGQRAGAASALLGASQFGIGALIAPLAGLGQAGSAIPMALVIAGSLLAAAVLVRLVLRPTLQVATA